MRRLKAEVADVYRRRLRAMEMMLLEGAPAAARDTGFEALLRRFWLLPGARQDKLLLSPALSRWLFTVGCRLHPGGGTAAEMSALLGKVSHALVPSLLEEGLLGRDPFFLWGDRGGDVRFSGAGVKLALGPRAAGRRLRAGAERGGLTLRAPGLAASIPLDRLTRSFRGELDGSDFIRPDEGRDPRSGIAFDSSEPLLLEVLGRTEIQNKVYQRQKLGAEPIDSRAHRAAFFEALALLEAVWPEEHRDVLSYASLVVPVNARRHLNGSLTHLQGTMLFTPRPQRWQNLEFIIHETVHLKMNLIRELFPLLRGRDRYLRSPWSGIPRLTSVMLEAGCIYLLVACGLKRTLNAGMAAPRQDVEKRIRRLAAGFKPFWKLMHPEELTPAGRLFLDSCRRQTQRLLPGAL
ncbi:MAG: aKG-HExxH-type peptide beta-hydroxylase [Elusimicrobiota bacterium]